LWKLLYEIGGTKGVRFCNDFLLSRYDWYMIATKTYISINGKNSHSTTMDAFPHV